MLNAGAAQAKPRVAKDYDFAIAPEDYTLHDLEKYQDKPRRVCGTFNAEDLASFCRYVTRFKDDSTTIAASVEHAVMTAVLDYHEGIVAPRFGEHKAVYAPPLSEEWKRWSGVDGKPMAQAAFAQFIEENAADIVEPAGAGVIDLARSLRATRKIDYQSEVDLADGTIGLRYEETTETHGSKRTEIAVPKFLMLGIPVFFGGTPYAVKAWFRYRVGDDKHLSFAIELHRNRFIYQDAFLDLVKAVEQGTEIEPLLGSL
jgi:uncharacterized protein YfdQ (DUF2303 family)